MQVSLEQLAACCSGVHSLTLDGDVVRFRRFPPVLETHYQSTQDFQIRCGCGAGVRLRFRSDTDTLWLSVRYGREARANYRGTLIVDGGDEHAWGPGSRQVDWSGTLFAASGHGHGEREFDLWLPHLCEIQLAALEIGKDASFTPVAPSRRRWLAFGDSITQGMTSTLPTRSYVARVARTLDLDPWNFGVGGERLVSALADGVPQGPFSIATVAYGTNDFARDVPLDAWRDNAVQLARALTAASPQTPVLFITPIAWVAHTTPNAIGLHLNEYRQALASALCGLRNVHVVDGSRLIDERADLFVDNVHPNDNGFTLYAERLGAVMRQYISR